MDGRVDRGRTLAGKSRRVLGAGIGSRGNLLRTVGHIGGDVANRVYHRSNRLESLNLQRDA